jgi:hypothetical protein
LVGNEIGHGLPMMVSDPAEGSRPVMNNRGDKRATSCAFIVRLRGRWAWS